MQKQQAIELVQSWIDENPDDAAAHDYKKLADMLESHEVMNEQKAREVLGSPTYDTVNGITRFERGNYKVYYQKLNKVALDGYYKPEALEALLWWMENKR